MEKINLVELLKDCPKGMELDCLLFKDAPVYFNRITNSCHYPIEIKVEYPDGSFEKFELSKEGCIYDRIIAKCVIFPKGKTTWEGFMPPCQFKDGDIISDVYFDAICIFKDEGNIKGTVDYYCGISGDDELLIKDVKNQDEYFGYINEYNLATEEEKEKLFDAIKANGYKWCEETKTLEKLPKFKVGDRIKRKGIDNIYAEEIADVTQTLYILKNKYWYSIEYLDKEYELVSDKFDINTLKPFDKVLVRDNDTQEWVISLFSHFNEFKIYTYTCINGNRYAQCIPYEQNKHLLGTTENCDEYFKNWE